MEESQPARESPATRADDDDEKNPFTVIVAMAANAVIMVAKLAMALISGSSAMLAEGVHSAVDTANQGLIIIGYRRSKRPPDREHPFGYGKEVYFWSLVYAGLMFAVGSGVSIYKGVDALLDPEMPTTFWQSYIVLGVAFIAEGTSWVVAVKTIQREERGRTFLDKLLASKNPARFIVVSEDTAAILGLFVAFAGLGLTQLTQSPAYDAIASILVGVLLGLAAAYLTVQTKKLILGQSSDLELRDGIRDLTDARDDVARSGEAFTMHVGPEDILVALDVKFKSNLSADDVARAVDEIEAEIREMDSRVQRIFVEAQLRIRDLEAPEDQSA